MDAGQSIEEQVTELCARVNDLEATNEKLTAEREQYRALYLKALEKCALLERGLVGKKREQLSENDVQLSLSLLETLVGKSEEPGKPAPEEQKVKAHKRKKPTGRKPLPEDLPHVDVEILPPEVTSEGLDAFERIGEDKSEVIERRPASLVVVTIHRPKFVRKERNRHLSDPMEKTAVFVNDPPELPIERGLAGPGMLADTIVKRWQDHLPLHRLEGIYRRDGLDLSRSTMCGWHEQLAVLVKPLVDAMWIDAFDAPYLCTDATGVLVQAKDRCKNGHFWVVAAPERHILFAYSKRHNGEAVDDMLAGYQGYLVADAHSVYDHLFKDGTIIECGCWAHARRYHFKALASDPDRARQALTFIHALFRIERSVARAGRKKREAARQRESRPIIDRYFAWCEHEAKIVLDATPISAAIRYSLNQREPLSRFLEDGRLPIHNNLSERQLRRQAVGRKNWLFCGSDDGAKTNTIFVTLLASCQLHEIEPWAYLRDLLCLLPGWPSSRVLELAPAYWHETLKDQDTQQRLAANVFRPFTLADAPLHPQHS